MLFWAGLVLLAIGSFITRMGVKYPDNPFLKKVGLVFIFCGVMALFFVLVINILVWTGRASVAA